jgi:prepilin-type N-terminal cleavage/methylation domain-containing protein
VNGEDEMMKTTTQPAQVLARKRPAFTLIELLVVISIIGLLASIGVGVSALAVRKSRESRIKTELAKLEGLIENYKTAIGFYPPDHHLGKGPGGQDLGSVPHRNQLFYELSGTIFRDNRFSLPGRQESLTLQDIQTHFRASGFSNAARDERDLKFSEEFRHKQYQRINANPVIEVLAVPVKGPQEIVFNNVRINPWQYVSTSPTNNAGRFDLWADVVIGNNRLRFSNWSKDPIVLNP